METPRKNVNKDGICLLCSRPIDPKQRTQRYNRTVKNIAKIQRTDVLCLSRPCLEAIYTVYNVYFR